MNTRPIVGITMGDPAGNGAEITVKALANPDVYENSRPIVIGDANCMEQEEDCKTRGKNQNSSGQRCERCAL